MDHEDELKAHMHILHQQKELLKHAKSRKGQRPTQAMRRSRAELEAEFLAEVISFPANANAALLDTDETSLLQLLSAQMGVLMTGLDMKTIFIGEAYPPSVAPISSLSPIPLRDLRLELHHLGRVLIARTFCEPVRICAIQNAIEDSTGSVNRLSIYNLPSTTPIDMVLPKGAVVAVKEPYLEATADGGVMVRVDHPSDFVLLDLQNNLVPAQWRAAKPAMTGSQLKEAGNIEFKQGNWQKAGELYTEALAKTDNDIDLRLTLHRNRAQVYLNLGQYEFASQEALAAATTAESPTKQAKSLTVKSFFRAARAEYQLGNFPLAKEYLNQAMGLDPMDRTVAADLARTKQRITEQQTGNYDFDAMARSATASHKKLDHASFTGNTRIGSAGGRGRGLFATKKIKHGDIIMVEKAFCAVFTDELDKECSFLVNINNDHIHYGTQAQRLYDMIDKIRCNPTQASEFLDLFDGGNFKSKKVNPVDGAVVLDVFQVQLISELNGFGCPSIRSGVDGEDQEYRESSGIWLRASYMNHSCIPNTFRAFIGDMMIVRAASDIKAGEEILTSYTPTMAPFPKRKKKLSSWGFQCDCRLCLVERKLPASVFAGRDRLDRETEDFIAGNQIIQANLGKPVWGTKLAEAKGIQKRLHASYDPSIYGRLPRIRCALIDSWIVQASVTDCQAGFSSMPDIAATIRLMRDLGYEYNVKGSEVSIDRTNGVVSLELVHTAMYCRDVYHLAGKPDAAMAFVELAKEAYLTICGVMEGFEERFGDN